MFCLLAERSDTKSNVKLGGFRFQFHASYVSSLTEELWYNETVCLSMTIYICVFVWVGAEKLGNKSECVFIATDIQKFIPKYHLSIDTQNDRFY